MILAVCLLSILVGGVDIARSSIQGFVPQKNLKSGRIGAILSQIGSEAMP
jgi:hypothetical protein